MQIKTNFKRIFILTILLVWGLFLIVACTNASSEPTVEPVGEQEEEHDAEGSHDEDEEHSEERIPNEGAVIRILAPADGAIFQTDQEIIVEIETENFALGEDGNHWEIYVDDSSWGSIEGGNDEVLRGLEPGEHEIAVYMSKDTHEQLEDGDSIVITVEE